MAFNMHCNLMFNLSQGVFSKVSSCTFGRPRSLLKSIMKIQTVSVSKLNKGREKESGKWFSLISTMHAKVCILIFGNSYRHYLMGSVSGGAQPFTACALWNREVCQCVSCSNLQGDVCHFPPKGNFHWTGIVLKGHVTHFDIIVLANGDLPDSFKLQSKKVTI